MKKSEKVFVCAVIMFAAIAAVFFGIRKLDYHVDEVWTFGLANHVSGVEPDIEFGKKYTGWGFYGEFVKVLKNERFNYVNLWQNQAEDVHPPLYYVFIHTICSLFPNTFSMWYGIAVNLIWMIPIVIVLYKLSKSITGDIKQAMGIVIVYCSSVGFFDTMIFIRMYAQFTFFAIALAYLLKIYWDKNNDRKFYIYFSVLLIFGMLTHYYFLIYTFAVCAAYGIHLILEKRYVELRKSILVALGNGFFYILIWYHILGHLFRGYRGKQALQAALSFGGVINGIVGMFSQMDSELFGGLLIIFIIFAVLLMFLKVKSKTICYSYKTALTISTIFYICVVGKIAPYLSFRYIMPVAFTLEIIVCCVLYRLFGLIKWNIKSVYVVTLLLVLINIISFVRCGFYIPKDNYSQEKKDLLASVDGADCIVYIEQNWEALNYFQALQDANSYIFIDEDTKDILNQIDDDYILVTTNDYKDKFSKYSDQMVVF